MARSAMVIYMKLALESIALKHNVVTIYTAFMLKK